MTSPGAETRVCSLPGWKGLELYLTFVTVTGIRPVGLPFPQADLWKKSIHFGTFTPIFPKCIAVKKNMGKNLAACQKEMQTCLIGEDLQWSCPNKWKYKCSNIQEKENPTDNHEIFPLPCELQYGFCVNDGSYTYRNWFNSRLSFEHSPASKRCARIFLFACGEKFSSANNSTTVNKQKLCPKQCRSRLVDRALD